jgi:hypothetical protein
VSFDAIAELGPVLVGRFWESQKAAFPRHQLVPAIQAPAADGVVFEFGPVPPLRTWLVSTDDTRVMQVQTDRFLLNWRARGPAYPSFNPAGSQRGLLAEAMAAFEAFCRFTQDVLGIEPRLTHCEVSMIDVLVQDRHWTNTRDLTVLVPCLAPFVEPNQPVPLALSILSEMEIAGGTRRVGFQRAHLTSGTRAAALRFESTARLESNRQELVSGLKRAHQVLKDTFDEFIPSGQHHRFETGWRPT